jgi:hypothetical protein
MNTQDTLHNIPEEKQAVREAKRGKAAKTPDKSPHRRAVRLPADQIHSRKKGKHTSMLRSVDDPWLGEEPSYLGMAVWTEEQLAEYAKVSVEQARIWITHYGLPTLPTPDGSVRIAEADFEEWANTYPGVCTGTHKLAACETCSHSKDTSLHSCSLDDGNSAEVLPDEELLIIEMNRFWKRSEVAAAYGIPDDLKYIVKEIPTAHFYDGDEYVKGHDVERVIDNSVPSARPDGPHPPDTMRVAGKDYHCGSGRRWQLLQCLWNKAAVTVDQVIEEVYGHDSEGREKSLDSLIKHTRHWLRQSKCPLTIRTQLGYVEILHTGGNKGPEGSMANPQCTLLMVTSMEASISPLREVF